MMRIYLLFHKFRYFAVREQSNCGVFKPELSSQLFPPGPVILNVRIRLVSMISMTMATNELKGNDI